MSNVIDAVPSEFAEPWLAPGARIAIVAPASPFDASSFELGVTRLRARYDVRFDPSILERSGYLAGHDDRRLRELQAALDDRSVDAIVAARGGYGATRLLPSLRFDGLRRRPKLLVGFSDITALHACWSHARVASVHGAMAAMLGTLPDLLFQRWIHAVEGRFAERVTQLACMREGQADGILHGGNLAVLTALIGTPHFPLWHDTVLYLEDTGERPYRVDRMLTTWRSANAFAGVKAVVLGAFVNADPGPDGPDAKSVLMERLLDLGIPVASELPAGHVDDNLELPFGTRVMLDATQGELWMMNRRSA
jgi:muramoyltetrapeptide carboxypeptidase